MNIQPICGVSTNNKNCKPINFNAKLNLTFPVSDISCDINKGEANFERVINKFRNWLSVQNPSRGTLTISKKEGNLVEQFIPDKLGAFHIEKRRENLQLYMNGVSCGFYWNKNSTEKQALEDLQRTFIDVRNKRTH